MVAFVTKPVAPSTKNSCTATDADGLRFVSETRVFCKLGEDALDEYKLKTRTEPAFWSLTSEAAGKGRLGGQFTGMHFSTAGFGMPPEVLVVVMQRLAALGASPTCT